MTDVLVKPAFQSPYPDSGDPTKFGPTAWNSARLFSQGNDGDVPVRDSLSAVGASWGVRSRVLTVNTTQSATPATTTETDLWVYSLPANTLDANGRAVRITAFGTLANNGNSKQIKLYFGATVIDQPGASTTTVANAAWRSQGVVIRTGATAQMAAGDQYYGGWAGAASGGVTTPAETLANAITIKVTGKNSIASAGDVVFKGVLVELL